MPRKAMRMRKPRRARKAPGRGRRPAKRGGKKAGLSPANQRATIVETLDAGNLVADQPYQGTFNLAQFYRATTLAKNFQFYRAKKVKYEYMPLYNTFQENNAVPAVAKPQIYFMMNRDQDPTAVTRAVEQGVTDVISLGLKKQFGWLATPDIDAWAAPNALNGTANPVGAFGWQTAATANAGVMYNGHNLYISQQNEPAVPVAHLVVTVEWEFKGGKNNYTTFGRTEEKPAAIELTT